MPVRRRDMADASGPSRRYDQELKPKVKPEPLTDNVIDLCDSDEEPVAPRKPASFNLKSPPKRSTARTGKVKDEFQDDHDPSESESSSDDDFRGSKAKRKSNKRPPAEPPSTAKLYAIARIVTLATDGVASVSQSEAKLAGVNSGILSRIQKSLALAKHPGTGEAEAQQALRLATRLMSSQNLTQADLLASSDSETNQSRAGMSIVEIVSQTNATPRNESWVNQVAIAVNYFFDVKAYSTSYANRTKLSWTFYGLAVNTVAAAHAFEMVHNQVLTWAYDKAAAKLVTGKTGKNSYCQGVAAGLIALARKEKKEEMRLAIESEQKRLKDAEEQEKAQIKKEKERLSDPPVKAEPDASRPSGVKAERAEDMASSSASGSRNVKLEDAVDEEDTKPFRNGFKRSASQDLEDGYGRWSNGGHGGIKPEPGLGPDYSDDEDTNDRFYDFNTDAHPSDDPEEDVKPHFDEALERDIIDLTSDVDIDQVEVKPKLEPDHDIKPKIESEHNKDLGAGWQSGNQLIRFRQDAEKIADDYLASQHKGLKLKKRAKSSFKKDSSAFEQGREDAKKIDVKRKRIQN
ncbi:Ankyrin repeat protein [Pseudozyma hubeiensis SY62]|uniref:Ankyrin repeat protein n=1 Tax=Pseudozyma hubeiensis (strain SY62) TaxID=1305764 RepID=R9P7T6_PSEHS|nr:Ankyrin repeat protein [Pseudozyma hubeiensis SY62]GAC97416.1 Ankyrin repeat protein [Pseudozyma hubeiensis SY62]